MSDINKMNFKELRNEVQLLRDELALFKRKFGDMIYNLDNDNFSSRVIKEKDDMRAEIKVTAEEISTKVSNEEFQSAISQTAEEISTKVSNEEFQSAISQTADKISGIVSEFIDTSKAVEVNSSDGFIDTKKIYVIRERDEADEVVSETFYYYNTVSEKWEKMHDSGIVNSLFEQTPDGFKLKGDVKVDGSCVLTESLTFDSSDRPVQVQYSIDGMTNWHDDFASGTDKFMRLKIGADWTDAMKVVGEAGKNGTNGNDASVTPQNVFNALTDNGATQGIFSAFYKGKDEDTGSEKLFINAELIKAGQLSADRIDTENLSCTKLYAKNNFNGYFARLNGYLGDFGIFNGNASDSDYSNDTTCLFGVYNSAPNVNFFVYGHNFMGVDVTNDTLWAKGAWDFSVADVTWGNNAPDAVFG